MRKLDVTCMCLALSVLLACPVSQVFATGGAGPVSQASVVTGLSIPRFASFRSDETNMRVGPGGRYPIAWVFRRQNLPVKIIRDFYDWRQVRTSDHVEGWVHKALLVGTRHFITVGRKRVLRSGPADYTQPMAWLEIGVIGRISSCAAGSQWCRVRVAGYSGYLRRTAFWGALPREKIGP
jgi:SH3-like domain-containing protein